MFEVTPGDVLLLVTGLFLLNLGVLWIAWRCLLNAEQKDSR